MLWHVQYRNGSRMGHILRRPTPELAIEAACRLIDEGCDVYGIGTGPLTDSIGRDEIVRIYDLWIRAGWSLREAAPSHDSSPPPPGRSFQRTTG